MLSWRLYVTPQKGKATFTVSERFYMLILKYIPEHFHDSTQQHNKSLYHTVLNNTYYFKDTYIKTKHIWTSGIYFRRAI